MDNRCVMCGEIIPEGLEVCPLCKAHILKEEGDSVNNRNSEGYYDPTASVAIHEVSKHDMELEKKVHNLVNTLKFITEWAGFEFIGRIQIRHKGSGKEFR